MLGFLDRFLSAGAALRPRHWLARRPRADGLLASPRASVVPGAIVHSRARWAQYIATAHSTAVAARAGRHACAAHQIEPARAFWISVDPQDTRRTIMAGTPREVCEVLDELLAMQEASAASSRPPRHTERPQSERPQS